MLHPNHVAFFRRLPSLVAVLLLTFIIPSVSQAQVESYMPLEVGNSWLYVNEAGGDLRITVVETFEVLGQTTHHLEFDTSGGAIFYNEYLSWNDQGQLLLHARKGPSTADPVVFDPPIVWFTPGSTEDHTGQVEVYADFEGNEFLYEGDYFSSYIGEEDLETPAGNFSTHHVEELNFQGDARWYSENTGLVQVKYLNGGTGTFQLVSTNQPVAVESSSWSGLKALYR